MNAIGASVLSLGILFFITRSAPAQTLPWYGAQVTIDFQSDVDPDTKVQLTQCCQHAALVMRDGSRFPLTMEFLWHRSGNDHTIIYSRPVLLTDAATSLTADVVTTTMLLVNPRPEESYTLEVPSVTTVASVEVIDTKTNERLGELKPLKGAVTLSAGTRALERVAIDLRSYLGRTVRFRVHLVAMPASNGLRRAPAPRFDVTRPERAVVAENVVIGPAGPVSPVDVPGAIEGPTLE